MSSTHMCNTRYGCSVIDQEDPTCLLSNGPERIAKHIKQQAILNNLCERSVTVPPKTNDLYR